MFDKMICPDCKNKLSPSHLEYGRWICKGTKGCNAVFDEETLNKKKKKLSIYNYGG